MTPHAGATRDIRRALLIVAALVLLGSGAVPSALAQASGPTSFSNLPSLNAAIFAQGPAKPKSKMPAQPEPSGGTNAGTIAVVVVGVLVFGGVVAGIIFLLANMKGGGKPKEKVSETENSIGGYEMKKMLQQGAGSQVWEVREIVSGRHFAMKTLLPESAGDPVQRKLLFNEAEVGIEMAHPNVIKIVRVFKESRTPCIVMEFFPSGSMRARIMYKDWDFIKEHAPNVMKQTATALAYMNSNGWLHRDVKPDNILVNSGGEVKLIDFAITERIPTGLSRIFMRKSKRNGTRSYMAPETIRCELLDTRAEIYSFGITCYEIVTFRTPFKAGSPNDLLNKHLFEKPVPPQAFCSDLTDEFNKFVLRMLAKKRTERPANFHEVLMELRKIKVFKSSNPAPPKDGGPLQLHPEALSAMRRQPAKPGVPGAPKAPKEDAEPKE